MSHYSELHSIHLDIKTHAETDGDLQSDYKTALCARYHIESEDIFVVECEFLEV